MADKTPTEISVNIVYDSRERTIIIYSNGRYRYNDWFPEDKLSFWKEQDGRFYFQHLPFSDKNWCQLSLARACDRLLIDAIKTVITESALFEE
jgi:protein-disulfide isomerase